MLVTQLVPPELQAATALLSKARRAAVLAARAAWIDGGLQPGAATRHAVRYATRLKLRSHFSGGDTRITRQERLMAAAFSSAVRTAQDAFPSERQLALIALGEVPWDALQPVLALLEANLG